MPGYSISKEVVFLVALYRFTIKGAIAPLIVVKKAVNFFNFDPEIEFRLFKRFKVLYLPSSPKMLSGTLDNLKLQKT